MALTFKHAVEFSSFGCTPCSRLFDFRLGQLDLLYFSSSTGVKSSFGSASPSNPAHDGGRFRPSGNPTYDTRIGVRVKLRQIRSGSSSQTNPDRVQHTSEEVLFPSGQPPPDVLAVSGSPQGLENVTRLAAGTQGPRVGPKMLASRDGRVGRRLTRRGLTRFARTSGFPPGRRPSKCLGRPRRTGPAPPRSWRTHSPAPIPGRR